MKTKRIYLSIGRLVDLQLGQKAYGGTVVALDRMVGYWVEIRLDKEVTNE